MSIPPNEVPNADVHELDESDNSDDNSGENTSDADSEEIDLAVLGQQAIHAIIVDLRQDIKW